MKIFVLSGSPRRDGNSNLLVNEFIKGAKESGHEVTLFEAANKNVHPCIACDKCKPSTECVFKDDFEAIKQDIIEADMVVLASPIYYYAMSAQIRTAIDRFYSIDEKLHTAKKSAIILTYADTSLATADIVIGNYKGMIDFLGWTDVGKVIAPGVWGKDDVKNTDFPQKAYELGKSL